jgi:hypothetical protein
VSILCSHPDRRHAYTLGDVVVTGPVPEGAKTRSNVFSLTAYGQNFFSREITKTGFQSRLYSLQTPEQFAQRDLQGSRKSLYGIQPGYRLTALDPVNRSALYAAGSLKFTQCQPSGFA